MNTTKKSITVKILRKPGEPEAVELIAAHIIEISEAFAKIRKTNLQERVIHLLVKDLCPNTTLTDIKLILYAAGRLKEEFIKK